MKVSKINALQANQQTLIIKRIDEYMKENCVQKQAKVDLRIDDLIKSADVKVISDQRYFIKPVGWSEQHFSETRTLDSDIEKLHFSKRRPRSVRVGDILICYAVGTAKLLGCFRVIEEPVYSNIGSDRWPWSVKAKNLSPKYSDNWTKFDNTISSIQRNYVLESPITFVGGTTLGALNFGADKIQLNEYFAKYVIKMMKNSSDGFNS